MAIQNYKPTSPGRRGATGHYVRRDHHEEAGEVAARCRSRRQAGRNNQGKITVRHRGGGAKRRLRIIDFKRDKFGIPGKVVSIEYDPNRSARICLVHYADGEKRYIIWPVGVKVGDTVMSGPDAEIKPGNALPLQNIPSGTVIHNIEMHKGKGAQIVRSAGGSGAAPGPRRRLRHDPPALRRSAPHPRRLHGHDRPGRQRLSTARSSWAAPAAAA